MGSHRIIIGYMLIGSSVAGNLEDFSNNLVSDLGPLLSLFGDSMTKQFLSESTTFLDYIIFAVGPIGIITAVVSAIRLCGSAALRAFIGRSQEGQGTVEAELCTSTSRDVCELFSKGGIQRVLGKPHILELVYIPRAETSKESQLLLSRDYFKEHAPTASSPWKLIKGAPGPEDNANSCTTLAPNPNLSLNIGIRRPPNWLLWIIATIGLSFQAGILLLSGVGVWVLKWNPSVGTVAVKTDRAAVMFIAGTILMVAGMWGCAFLIGQTTHETCFERKTAQKKSRRPQILWLQPGRQVIGDQSFDSFAYLEDTGKRSLQTWMSSTRISAKRFELFTYISVLATIVGYVIQFIGMRGLKLWVAVAQLSLTLFMSCVRGLLRTQRLGTNDNELRAMPDMVAGHELDWLAFRLAFRLDPHASKKRPLWHITGQHEKAKESEVPVNDSETSLSPESESIPKNEKRSGPTTTTTKPIDRSASLPFSNRGTNNDDLLQIRLRLAHLTGLHSMIGIHANHTLKWDDKHVKVRAKARQLSHAISEAATELFLQTSAERNNAVKLHIRAASVRDNEKEEQVSVTLTPPLASSWSRWYLDPAELEAILGLWMWTITCGATYSLDLDNPTEKSLAGDIQTARIISCGEDSAHWDDKTDFQDEMNLWLGRGAIKFRQSTVKLTPQHPYGLATIFSQNKGDSQSDWEAQGPDQTRKVSRFAGWNATHHVLAATHTQSHEGLDSKSDQATRFRLQIAQIPQDTASLLDICCQELFVALIMSLLEYDNAPIKDATLTKDGGLLRLQHPTVSVFADAFVAYELGTYVDALLCIIPALRATLPALSREAMLLTMTRTADVHHRESRLVRAERALTSACMHTKNKIPSTEHFVHSLRALCELYRWSLSAFSGPERAFGLKGIENVVQMYSDVGTSDAPIKVVIESYQEIARKFENGDADEDRGQGVPSCFKANQNELLRSLKLGWRAEALYYICLLTPESLQRFVVPKPALSTAAKNNWIEVVDVLLKLKAQPNDSDGYSRSGISYCAELGHEECARILLAHGASLHGTWRDDDFQHHTPFTVAARNGHLNMIKLFLDSGFADLDETDSDENSPLAIAASCGHTEIVEALLKTGNVDLDLENIDNCTALELAASSNHMNVVRLLLDAASMQLDQKDRKWGIALWWAAIHGDKEAVEGFIDGGANIEFKDSLFLQTALSSAVMKGHMAVVRELLRRGANVNTQADYSKETPLMNACSNIFDLSPAGADPKKAQKRTDKIKASKAIAALLIVKGAKLELQDKKGLSALARAAQYGHKTCLKFLLAKHANIESRDEKNRTPLMHAVKRHRKGAIRILLQKGAKLEAMDAEGKTPLFYAIKNQNMLDFLISSGANTEAKDEEGYTALTRAEQLKEAKSAQTEQRENDGRDTDEERETLES